MFLRKSKFIQRNIGWELQVRETAHTVLGQQEE